MWGRKNYRKRRLIGLILFVAAGALLAGTNYGGVEDIAQNNSAPKVQETTDTSRLARSALNELPAKGRAAKTGYNRENFSDGWGELAGCGMRDVILNRDLRDVQINIECQVVSGVLNDPYTGKQIVFKRGPESSQMVQIDHVVALSNAWQTGAQQLPQVRRYAFSNDPLNLLAVDGETNNQKGSSDAASWLPPHKPFRCQYVARQIAVKQRYNLWVTPAEKQAMEKVLSQPECSNQTLP
ncbi:HNH endonuclease [Candidatus Saccharibacteria bacterium]|nr:HNH endonuclease [Candidatus Saccharibacteria bacterium]